MKEAIISKLVIGITILIAMNEKGNPINKSFKDKKALKVTTKEFVNTIDSLGYFKYTDKGDLEALKESHLGSFSAGGSWGGIWDDETSTPYDYRYCFCDGETVFEQGRFTDMLDELKPTFQKIDFKLNINNHFEEWDDKNEWLNHNITINDNDYVIFKNFKGYGWGEAVQRLAEILNIEFEKQNIKERVYLINGRVMMEA